jgi:hypothetical protein
VYLKSWVQIRNFHPQHHYGEVDQGQDLEAHLSFVEGEWIKMCVRLVANAIQAHNVGIVERQEKRNALDVILLGILKQDVLGISVTFMVLESTVRNNAVF